MHSHHPIETYFRQGAELGLRQQVFRQKVPVDRALWPRIWNLLLLLGLLLVATHLRLAHLITDFDQALQTTENVRHELMETQISLRAARDRAYAPDNVLMLASQRLSLRVPDREQIKSYQ